MGKSIGKNYIYNLIYQILTILVPVITTPYLSRVIGADGVGIFSYNYSIAQYFVLFIMLGINNYGNRTIATVNKDTNKRQKTFSEIYTLQFMLGILVLSIYYTYVAFFHVGEKTILYIVSIYLVSAILDINWFFFGMEEFKITVTRNSIFKILSTICIFLFVKDSNDLIMYILIMAIGNFISQAILWLSLRKFAKFKFSKFKNALNHLKPNLILFIPVIATSIYTIMDKIMLGEMSNMFSVGLYENADKIKNILMGFITALGTVMIPKMTSIITEGKRELADKYIYNSLKYILLLVFAMSFGLAGISKEFVVIFFGEEFRNSYPIMIVLSASMVFISWANVIRTQKLIPEKLDKIYIISTIVGAVVNFVLNIFLIAKLDAVRSSSSDNCFRI